MNIFNDYERSEKNNYKKNKNPSIKTIFLQWKKNCLSKAK